MEIQRIQVQNLNKFLNDYSAKFSGFEKNRNMQINLYSNNIIKEW